MVINKIGIVENQYLTLEQCPANGWKSSNISRIVIEEQYIDGLVGLKKGDMLHVLWWFSKAPRDILKNYVGEDEYETGVFAMRSPHRPNPIALSLCKLLDINCNILTVVGIEAINGSEVVDIKKAIKYEGVIL